MNIRTQKAGRIFELHNPLQSTTQKKKQLSSSVLSFIQHVLSILSVFYCFAPTPKTPCTLYVFSSPALSLSFSLQLQLSVVIQGRLYLSCGDNHIFGNLMRGKGREDIGIGGRTLKGGQNRQIKGGKTNVGPLRMGDMEFQCAFESL